jgi:hypothetical protein
MGTTRYELVPLAGLDIHPGYQRGLDEGRVQKIVAEFDPRLLGVLMVSEDGSGKPKWVFDGQHRLESLRRMGWTEAFAQISADAPADQARLFVKGQEERKNITPGSRHRAMLFAGDPIAAEIDSIIASFGYKLSNDAGEKNIRAVRASYWIHAKGGSSALRRTMTVVTSAWSNLTSAFDDRVLKGLALALIAYPDLDVAVVADAVRNESPRALLLDSQAKSTGAGSNNHTEFARTIIRLVNKQTGRRLRDPFTRGGRVRAAKQRVAKAKASGKTNGKAPTAAAVTV